MRTPYVVTLLSLLLAISPALANLDPGAENRINQLISQMTLAEKVSLCQGLGRPTMEGVPRLHIPNLVATDGPSGPHRGTAFPCGVAMGATWNPALLEQAA